MMISIKVRRVRVRRRVSKSKSKSKKNQNDIFLKSQKALITLNRLSNSEKRMYGTKSIKIKVFNNTPSLSLTRYGIYRPKSLNCLSQLLLLPY